MPDMPVDHYPARDLARAWLTVAQASGTDKAVVRTNRTVSVDTFWEGVRLTATDLYMVITAWVPNVDHELARAPDPDEPPDRSEVVADVDKRAVALMKYVVKLTAEEDEDDWLGTPAELTVQWDVDDPDDEPVLDDSLATKWTALSIPDRERVHLPTLGIKAADAHKVALAPPAATGATHVGMNLDLLYKLAPCRRWYPGCAVRWAFAGPTAAVAFTLHGSRPPVHGALMPMRLDLPTDDGEARSVTITADTAKGLAQVAGESVQDAAEKLEDEL